MQTTQYKKYLAAYKERKDAQDRIEADMRNLVAQDAARARYSKMMVEYLGKRHEVQPSLWRRLLNGWSFYYTNVLFGPPASMNVPRSDDVPRGT